jgi:hypothetical protein
MSQVIDGVKAPTGGFQQGGWYEGRQYWNGTLSAPGVINSQSDQVGAGQAVSSEILQATSIAAGKPPDANQNYIRQQQQKLSGGGSSQMTPSSLASYLGDFQSSLFNSSSGDLASTVMPQTPAPAPINRLEMLEQYRSDMGVDALEEELNSLKNEEREIQAVFRANRLNEEGKPVALGVMEGRIGEEGRQAQMNLDFLNVRKATLVDELNTKYNAINMYINLAGLDYQDARQAYESDFSMNLQMANFISQEKQNSITNARANLTTIMNAITAGNLSYGQLSSDEQVQIMKLEMQSGLPVGTMSRMQMSPNDKILGFSDDKTQVMMMDNNGNFVVRSTGLKASASSGKQTEAESKREMIEAMTARIRSGVPLVDYSGKTQDIMSFYRSYLDPNEIYAIYNANSPWGPAKESAEELSRYGIKDEYKY